MGVTKKKVAVIGGSGFLGRYLLDALRKFGIPAVCISRSESSAGAILANYQDPKSLYAILERNEVGLICNLAAYTDVNNCEANFDLAYQANCGIVETLAKWCAESPNRHLIQISTDHVYDAMGASKEPDVRILNGYAMSKYAGELAARCVDATVLRVNFFGPNRSEKGQGIYEWCKQNFKNRSRIIGYEDVFFSPLGVDYLADLICMVIRKPIPGTFNVGSREGMSKGYFLKAIAKASNMDTDLVSLSVRPDARGAVQRPVDMRMDCSLFEEVYEVVMPSLKSEINRVVSWDIGL